MFDSKNKRCCGSIGASSIFANINEDITFIDRMGNVIVTKCKESYVKNGIEYSVRSFEGSKGIMSIVTDTSTGKSVQTVRYDENGFDRVKCFMEDERYKNSPLVGLNRNKIKP